MPFMMKGVPLLSTSCPFTIEKPADATEWIVSGTGIVTIKDVTVANGEISGHLMTHPNADLFDEPLVVDLHFHVKQP